MEISRIPVSYRDCVKLGGNLVSLGNKRILSMSHNVNVNAQLEAEEFTVNAIEYDMFALGGGGVHCSCHEPNGRQMFKPNKWTRKPDQVNGCLATTAFN